ncbi:hypothetical protein AGLY_003412 [Aphis glycines]|uniref:DDE-1 domain-containing protein n=1 Tax=Aphis glycines TaxID=307491 RepID=A0A6G0TZL7_APHGL|nr:hypothetical protein AGLY_003412 [Aphis glycines]
MGQVVTIDKEQVMVRNYIKKTNRGTVSEDIYKNAAAEVLSKVSSLRNAAEKYEINFMTLQRYIKRQSNLPLKPNCKLVDYAKYKQIFLDELKSTLSNYLVHCSRIYYGFTLSDVKVLAYEYAKSNNVAYPKGWNVHKTASKDWFTRKKRVGRSTSGERGTTVTMVFVVNAIGNSLPPMLIFPRVNFKQLYHFHKHINCSPSSPVLLILDNHISHLSINVIDFCKENGIVLLSFPPHTTNHLQPLDVSVYVPFKTFYKNSASRWMTTHPGNPISIYDIPSLVKESLPLAATSNNITTGFTKTGIWPFNRNVFTDEDYLCSDVTDRPFTTDSINDTIAIELSTISQPQSTTTDNNIDHTLIQNLTPNTPQCVQPSTSGYIIVTPEDIRPLPKDDERRNIPFSKSRKGEDWVECCSCKKWAHHKCAGANGLLFYNCKNCSSDFDEGFEDTE